MAGLFFVVCVREIDNVVGHAETRGLLAATLAAAVPPRRSGRVVATW